MYQWQGENVKVVFGYCTITENKEKPLYWYNYEVAMAEGEALNSCSQDH